VEERTTINEEHLPVAFAMMEEGIRFSPYYLKLTTMVRSYLSLVIFLAKLDVELHLHAPQTKNEHFWMYVSTNSHPEKIA
jgi:hypothetical protein